jgi:hypothetical protein
MAKPKIHTIRRTLRLSPALQADIEKWARKRKISQAEAIRQLVEQALKEPAAVLQEQEAAIAALKERLEAAVKLLNVNRRGILTP